MRFNDDYLLTVSTAAGEPASVDRLLSDSVAVNGYFELVRDGTLKTADNREAHVKANAFTDASDEEAGTTMYFIRLDDRTAITIVGDTPTSDPSIDQVDALIATLDVAE